MTRVRAAWVTCLACYSTMLVTVQRCLVCGSEGNVAGEPSLVEGFSKAAGRRSRWKGVVRVVHVNHCTCAEVEGKRAA
jgi:hypothetical protein